MFSIARTFSRTRGFQRFSQRFSRHVSTKTKTTFNGSNGSKSHLPLFCFAAAGLAFAYQQREDWIVQSEPSDFGKVTHTGKQNFQVDESRNAPGLWLWGSNRTRLIEDSTDSLIKSPKMLPCFEGWVMRDVSLAEDHGAVVDVNGDLHQFGKRFGSDPIKTLTGKKLKQIVATKNKVYGLSENGKVYIVGLEESALVPSSGGWWPFGGSDNAIQLQLPKDLSGEKIVSLAGGLHHVSVVTSSGKLLTAATDLHGNRHGQLGINNIEPVASEKLEQDPAYSTELFLVELYAPVVQIACGHYHTIVRTKDGRAYAFGGNTFGQCATGDLDVKTYTIPYPYEVTTVWSRTGIKSKPGNKKIVNIGAGGLNSVIVVDDKSGTKPNIELFVAGSGQFGQLGNGTVHFIHRDTNFF
jgi:alpha-tubulin suppressor-like RCC1 family protein